MTRAKIVPDGPMLLCFQNRKRRKGCQDEDGGQEDPVAHEQRAALVVPELLHRSPGLVITTQSKRCLAKANK